MGIELPHEYQPSADEEFMNPKQVEYFRRRLEESRADLRRELAASQPSEADDSSSREGDQTDHASADSEREFRSKTANGSRCCCGKRNGRFQSSRMVHTAIAKTPANRSI